MVADGPRIVRESAVDDTAGPPPVALSSRFDPTLKRSPLSPKLMVSRARQAARSIGEFFSPVDLAVPAPYAVPWRSVCLLEITYDSGRSATATGFLVSSTVVITAAHNLVHPLGRAHRIVVSPGKSHGRFLIDGQSQRLTLSATRFKPSPGWPASIHSEDELKNTDPAQDYAAIFLDSDLFAPLGPFFEPIVRSNAELDQHRAEGMGWLLVGYPHDSRGKILKQRQGPELCRFLDTVRYDMDGGNGDSGGPVFAYDDHSNRGGLFIGIHTDGRRGDNCGYYTCTGRRVTADLKRMIDGWIEEGQRWFIA